MNPENDYRSTEASLANGNSNNVTTTVPSEEAMRKLQHVRRSTWRGGLVGLLLGSAVGVVSGLTEQRLNPSIQSLSKQAKNNRLALWVMLSACGGSYIASYIYGSRSAQFHGGVVNMLRPNVEVNTNIAESNEKPSSYSERVYNNIMHSEETFQRRQEAIRETKETRGSGSY